MQNKVEILYVEDNEDYIDFVKRALRKVDENLHLEYATDGKSAMNFFSDPSNKKAFKLILLDINLPGITGIELLQKIRSNPGLAFTPIIMFSTSDNPRDVKNCYENGANAYLIKPMGLHPLMDTLRSVCDFWLEHNYSNN
jgi:CheY-like chemotaxis protein